jgi:ElaB/YqjD/DUF883 family membrane-anchored ribosome-binding protein
MRRGMIAEFRGFEAFRSHVGFSFAREALPPLHSLSMKDNQTPATKADIQAVMTSVESLMDEIGKLYDANERWKDELKDHFDLVIENVRSELLRARHDKVELLDDRTKNLDRRVSRLEVRMGV